MFSNHFQESHPRGSTFLPVDIDERKTNMHDGPQVRARREGSACAESVLDALGELVLDLRAVPTCVGRSPRNDAPVVRERREGLLSAENVLDALGKLLLDLRPVPTVVGISPRDDGPLVRERSGGSVCAEDVLDALGELLLAVCELAFPSNSSPKMTYWQLSPKSQLSPRPGHRERYR